MSAGRSTLRELALLLVLLALPAVPLFGFRFGYPPAWALWTCLAAWLALATWWCARRRRDREPASPAAATRRERLRTALVCALLLALTLVGYFVPLTKHFWGGVDEHAGFGEGLTELWSTRWDETLGRPTLGWAALLSRALTPDSLDGFLYVAAALCWLNALLLLAIVRRLAPQAAGLAAVAAALLIVSRSDASRFYVLWTADFYLMALFLFLASLWLLVVSRQRRSRALLLVACALLAAGLLASEGLFPLALLGFAALWATRREGPGTAVWTWAWFGTLSLLAVRFLVSLSTRGTGSYQSRQVDAALRDPASLGAHLGERLKSFRLYFDQPFGWMRADQWGTWMLAFALAAACALLAAAGRHDPAPGGRPRRAVVLGLGLALAAFLLGVAPFLHIAGTFRTMFFAAPGQALVLAFLFGLPLARVAPRARAIVLAALVGVLAAGATTQSSQAQEDKQLTADVRLDKTIHVYEQVRAVVPQPAEDVLVLFVVDDGASPVSPWNYSTWFHAWAFLGMAASDAGASDELGQGAAFSESAVTVPFPSADHPSTFPYERVVAFQTSSDGTLSLLRAWPPRSGTTGSGYDPLAHLRAGSIAPLRHLRSRYVAEHPVDVVDAHRGTILTGEWYPLQVRGRDVYRWAKNGAGFVVNPAAAGEAALELDVEPGGALAGKPCELKITNARNEVVHHRPFVGRQTVRLEWPRDAQGLQAFHVTFEPGEGSTLPPEAVLFRVLRERADPGPLQTARDAVDVFEGDLTPGRDWEPLRRRKGRGGERWARSGAELITGAAATRALEVTLEPERGTWAWRVEILDEQGEPLAEASVEGRRTLRFPLAREVGPGSRMHLRWLDRSSPTPNPTNVRMRVFRIRSEPHAE